MRRIMVAAVPLLFLGCSFQGNISPEASSMDGASGIAPGHNPPKHESVMAAGAGTVPAGETVADPMEPPMHVRESTNAPTHHGESMTALTHHDKAVRAPMHHDDSMKAPMHRDDSMKVSGHHGKPRKAPVRVGESANRGALVIGSFIRRVNADRAAGKWAHLHPEIVPTNVHGAKRYRVVVRPGAHESFDAKRRELRSAGITGAWYAKACAVGGSGAGCIPDRARQAH